MDVSNRTDRLVIVNNIIQKISRCGRRFFYHADSVAYLFYFKNTVYYHDAWVGDIKVKQDKPLKKHIGGGTLQALVKDFANFVETGEYSNSKNGYGGLFCPHWGYCESDMLDIQNYARELGYLNDSKL